MADEQDGDITAGFCPLVESGGEIIAVGEVEGLSDQRSVREMVHAVHVGVFCLRQTFVSSSAHRLLPVLWSLSYTAVLTSTNTSFGVVLRIFHSIITLTLNYAVILTSTKTHAKPWGIVLSMNRC